MVPLILGAMSLAGAYLQSKNKGATASGGSAVGTGQVNNKFQNDFSGWTVSTGSSKATGGARTQGAETMGGFDIPVPGSAGAGGYIVPSESTQLEKIAIGLAVGLGLASLMRKN
jgi:hypothetical protein